MGCVHKWNIDNHNVGTCLLCSEVRQFPLEAGEKPVVLKKGHPRAKKHRAKGLSHDELWRRHDYYVAHKDEIIADLFALGNAATRKKWEIPIQTVHNLKSRWLTPEQRAQITRWGPGPAPSPLSSSSSSGNGRLPHFPEFSNNWEPEVQLQWLEVYGTLASERKGGI